MNWFLNLLVRNVINWKGNQKGKGTDETLHYQVGKLDIWNVYKAVFFSIKYFLLSQNVNKILHFNFKNRFTFRILYVNLLPIPFWLFLDFVISMRNIISRRNLSVQFHSCKSREKDRCKIYVFRLDLAKQWSKIGSLIA